MGCNTSKEMDPDFCKSKATKKNVAILLEAANDWKSNWADFVDALEKNQLNAAHWSQVSLINKDEEESGDVDFHAVFKSLSVQSTELFILSRSFIDQQEDYIIVLTELLSELRLLHFEIKTKLKLEREVAKLSGNGARVFPEEEDLAEFQPEMNVLMTKKKKLGKSLETIKALEACIQTRVFTILFNTLKSLQSEHGKMWNLFIPVFDSMLTMANQLDKERKKFGFSASIQKQKSQRDARMKLLSKWLYCANRCHIYWEKLRLAESINCSTLTSLVSITKIAGLEQNNEFETFLQGWAELVEVQLGAKPNTAYSKHDVFRNIANTLNEQVTLLSQIHQREGSIKDYIRELETVQQDTTIPTKERNIKLDASKHKLSTFLSENRYFRLEQLRLFEVKCWQSFKTSSVELGKIYSQLSEVGSSGSIPLDSQKSMDSINSILGPLNRSPKPPPYSDSSRKAHRSSSDAYKGPRASITKRGSVGSIGLAGLRRISKDGSVPSISVHLSQEEQMNSSDRISPSSTPTQPFLLDPSRAIMGKQQLTASVSTPFASIILPKAASMKQLEMNPSKPPPPVPKRRQTGGSNLFMQ